MHYGLINLSSQVTNGVSLMKQNAFLISGFIVFRYSTYPNTQTRPDLDNVMKIVLDAMNGVAYADDAEVTNITATRSFSIDGSESLIVGLYWEEEAEHENRAVGASKGSGCEIISDGEENASEARLDGNQG